jgi:hypothetical protein
MKNKFLTLATVVLVSSFFFSVQTVSAQCNSFTKKKCMPALLPYIHNGQLNSTTLFAGETAELMMTFYSGQNYRVMACAQPNLGNVQFRLMDANRKLVYDNKDHELSPFWDFNVSSTQQFIIEIIVPQSDTPNDISQSGCVSLLIGFKE